jgi:ParB family chromosome partitioning protein
MSKRKLVLANNPLLSGPALGERDRGGIPYRVLPLASIDRDPNQPRTMFDEERLNELSSSIKAYGVLSPILVRPSETPGRYTLISGERRMRAAHLAGLSSIPTIVDQREEGPEDRTLAIQLVENLQRADLSALERAHAIGALRDTYKLSVRDIAEKLGISKSMVQRSLEILELPDDLLSALRDGASESKVLLLAKISDPDIRASYLRDLESLTRSELEKNMRKGTSQEDRTASVSDVDPEDRRITEEIQRAIGLKVRMMRSAPQSESGRLVIDFYSNQDLQELFRRLVNQ